MEKRSNLLLSICFLGFLAFIAIATWTSTPPEVLSDENRKMATLPHLSRKTIATYPQAFEAYFNDRLFSRSELVKTRNLFRFKFWQLSDAPNILVGKNGWLYFLGETGSILTAKEQPYTQGELDQWKNVLSSRAEYFAKRGMKYVFVVAPNKQSVYPEFFPLFSSKNSRLDQLSRYLGQYPEVPFISLKDPLIDQKQKKDGVSLYFKTDTHWNELGAFVADQYISSLLSASIPGMQPIAASSAKFTKESFSAGDCTKLMGLFGWVKETVPIVKMVSSTIEPKFEKGTGHATEISTFSQAAANKAPKAVIFHDSFGEAINPYLARHFSRAAYQLRQADLAIDLDLVEAEKPDLIIQEVVERHVVQLLPNELHDWRYEIRDAIEAELSSHGENQTSKNTIDRKNEWLCVLPCTNEVNSTRLQEVLREPHSNVSATTCRQWTDAGVFVSFDPRTVDYFQWYLTKTGAQEKSIGISGKLSPGSVEALADLSDCIQTSGKFSAIKSIKMVDGSTVTLWRLKKN